AMDGFAVRAADLEKADRNNRIELACVATVEAGSETRRAVDTGECIRIFTGAPLPHGADAVVMQEDTENSEDSGQVLFAEPIKPWENIRFRGEDIRSGSSIASTGHRIGIGVRAVLYGAGVSELEVVQKPKVAVLATGNELREPGEVPLAPGQIYETNRSTLAAFIEKSGCEAVVFPLVPDTLEATQEAFRRAFKECDAVITSGGVSVGQMDFVKTAFDRIGGELSFWRVAMRPGKQFGFGRFQSKYWFGLPGNPVSSVVTFLLLVRPALDRLSGLSDLVMERRKGTLGEDLSNPGNRTHFFRVIFKADNSMVFSAGAQGSHRLLSLSQSNGLLEVPPDTIFKAGQECEVLMWD
ncbi:MAG TPA: molybdopterin molybdenumtransferase MoeA, partial [Verrucomicrobia bacterium]|nr:molybdopterin molybdenumtransferase MoeA [Verrucomicrobiota bacterium]